MRTHLLIDTSYLAYRSLYSVGDLSFEGIETGAIYGMFRAVLDLQEIHETTHVVWCFDRGYGKRLEISRSYKANRSQKDKTDEERELHQSMRRQLYRLRTDYLPAIGFKNICHQEDYEADDVIASICDNLSKGERAIIVASDSDLFQLLRENVSIWSPSKERLITVDSFRQERGIDPKLWADVKAIAGCSSDHVLGIVGVGEKTAVKFLQGNLKPTTKAFQAIVEGTCIWKDNLPLVRLPFPGIKRFRLAEDGVTEDSWDLVVKRLGMKSLFNKRNRRRGFDL